MFIPKTFFPVMGVLNAPGVNGAGVTIDATGVLLIMAGVMGAAGCEPWYAYTLDFAGSVAGGGIGKGAEVEVLG